MKQTAFFRSKSGPDEAAVISDDTQILAPSLAQMTGGADWRLTLMHDRAVNVLVWVTRGQGRVFVNGIRRGLGAHNAVYLPAGTLFALDLGPQSSAQFLLSPPGRTGLLPQSPLHLRVRDGNAQAELTAAIETMQREVNLQRPHAQTALAAHMGLVAVWLKRQDGAGLADKPTENASTRLTRRFAALVVDHFRTDMVMQDYAEQLDVTPTHLTRVCRDSAGRTAADILTERKLHAALVALEDGDARINRIAADLGFNSPAYFTRFIQTHTGLAPSDVRKLTKRRSR